MRTDELAPDRVVMELPDVAGRRRLADGALAEPVAAQLWAVGPTPLVALVCYDGAPPAWLAGWSARALAFDGGPASVVVLASREELVRFLTVAAHQERVRLLWPRRSEAELIDALVLGAGTRRWREVVAAYAQLVRDGRALEVVTLAT